MIRRDYLRGVAGMFVFAVAMVALGAAVAAPASAATAGPSIQEVSLSSIRIARYGLEQIAVGLDADYTNPFDPDQIDLSALFTGPGGEQRTVIGFTRQNYRRSLGAAGYETLSPVGKPQWLIRFTPDRAGAWNVRVSLRSDGRIVHAAPRSFTVTASTDPGFVRVSKRAPTMFSFDDGKPYFAIGEDMCWAGKGGTYDYDNWLAKLHDAKGNWIRVWMGAPANRIEWSKSDGGDGLGRYDMANAWRLGKILSIAAKNDVNVMVCFGTYGEFTSGGFFNEGEWDRNPYNAKNGGPCQTPAQFWTDPAARKMYRQRLRYIMARYAWRTNIMGWEFWNETDAPQPWIHEMAEYLRGKGKFAGTPADPYGHLLSTTWGNPSIWALPEIDFTQSHLYGVGDTPDMSPGTVADAAANRKFGKPHLEAENGISWKGPDTQFDPQGKGVDLHDCIWAATAAGDAGSSMIWWWDDYVAPDNLYHIFTPLAKFAASVPWNASPWHPLTSSVIHVPGRNGQRRDLTISPSLGWGADQSAPETIAPDNTGATAVLPGFIYGSSKPAMQRPVTMRVDFAAPGALVLHVATVSWKVLLTATVDGHAVWSHDFEADPSAAGPNPEYKSTAVNKPYTGYVADFDKDYSIPIPTGRHTVSVSARDGDWLSIQSYRLQGYIGPDIADATLTASANSRCAVVWIHNSPYDWYNVLHGTPITPISGARTALSSLAPGRYKVTWFDTSTGRALGSTVEKANRRGLALAPPAFSTDIAARIDRLSAP